jgi:hypothetical protein
MPVSGEALPGLPEGDGWHQVARLFGSSCFWAIGQFRQLCRTVLKFVFCFPEPLQRTARTRAGNSGCRGEGFSSG